MNPSLIAVIGSLMMVVFLLIGMPIAFSMGIAGFAGIIALLGFSKAVIQLPLTFFSVVSDYNFTVLPFFILMGYFAADSGITENLFSTAEKWLRRLPGGLGLATIAGCAGFASICGSSVATAATMGQVALPEMKKHGYSDELAAGCVAAGGTLGFLIPPSVAFVVYGIIAEQSVGKLLISGILPGILLTVLFMIVILIRVKMNPCLAPMVAENVTWKERLLSIKDIGAVLFIFLFVMGGLYMGFFTATEAGAMGAFILLILAIVRKKMTFHTLAKSLIATAEVSCMIFLIIFAAMLFNDFMTLSRAPSQLMQVVGGLDISKYIIFAMIIIIYLILGCFIESIPMIILTVPVVLPILMKLGFDPIWFGTIIVLMVEAALITPPVGMNVYIIAGSRKLPVSLVFRGSVPFVIAVMVEVVILTIYPVIATFLPNLMIK